MVRQDVLPSERAKPPRPPQAQPRDQSVPGQEPRHQKRTGGPGLRTVSSPCLAQRNESERLARRFALPNAGEEFKTIPM